jgi:hypothetical protein
VVSDISPKVTNPALCLAGLGAVVAGIGAARADQRMREAGALLLGAAIAAGAIGWASRDPMRTPVVEPGFEPEPELAEHRAREEIG